MDEYDAVLIYDGECAYCSIAAKALRKLDRVGAISWYDDASQAFLEAQFGETPFAMFLVDRREGRVYAGGDAAEELADRAGTPGIVGSLVRDNYDRIAATVGAVTGRDRDPDDYHETYPLADEARALFDGLLESAEERPEALS
ncbi:Predicted thiol-disulfide oxidoreductase YuxK, DCC family [Halopelagius inordinatus]|uniref:Predicted thiol-disulfide oxidoreductase YuxK, DCC family n=1 Tax=Halopelagius inordinatus TaxID=553467 RepID=A0A1I2UYP4_9EURY|nr:DCC1-like thiol-disulfide oxidoreductase family protein [Halopelagius inordinatus]SFG80927.1 Predicted thiol-disulfide oxidoreductase YuxK, DCC family [Halopelagius inordinatus]